MDADFDDLRSLSERILPHTSASYTNHTSSRSTINRNRAQKSLSFDNSICYKNTSLPTNATSGDIVQMNDGTRKKYNGSSWRRMCSKPNCSYYTQSQGLCKPHLAALKKRQNSKTDHEIFPTDQRSTEEDQPKKGDIIILPNGIRKKYDGRQYRRVCANANCTIVVHGSLEYQNGLCPHHYQEYCAKTIAQSPPEPPTPPVKSVISSPKTPSTKFSFNHSRSSPKNSIPKPNRRLSIAVIPASVDIEHPNKGDIIEMENGSRKKFDGVVWRTICSIPECLIAAQRDELCRKHFIKLNGKPNTAPTMAMTMLRSARTNSTSSIDDKPGKNTHPFSVEPRITDINEESVDYDDNPLQTMNFDRASDSSSIRREQTSPTSEENFDPPIEHTFINALSASREKFPTTYLKKWLRNHRDHPYPTNQEKLGLAKQSSITFDQVTTWFNNARAILRRRQAKFQQSVDTTDEDEEAGLDHRSLPMFIRVCSRSIGVQCTPSTADQSTNISLPSEEELGSDRTIRILTPSSRGDLKRKNSQEFSFNGTTPDRERKMILTSTCLDDDQMNRVKMFCTKFHIESSNAVDEHTTHLITDEEGQTLVCPLSKKVIQAVARHMYIVTYRWIDACLQANRILHEKAFEIQGDLTLSSDHHGMQRSRQSRLPENLPSNFLLENFSIMLKCDGCQDMMNNEELIELVQLSGAKHTTDSHFSRLQTSITRVVLCEKEYLTNRREMYEKCVQAGIHFLTPEWFLETLVQYRIQPFQEYQISP